MTSGWNIPSRRHRAKAPRQPGYSGAERRPWGRGRCAWEPVGEAVGGVALGEITRTWDVL